MFTQNNTVLYRLTVKLTANGKKRIKIKSRTTKNNIDLCELGETADSQLQIKRIYNYYGVLSSHQFNSKLKTFLFEQSFPP